MIEQKTYLSGSMFKYLNLTEIQIKMLKITIEISQEEEAKMLIEALLALEVVIVGAEVVAEQEVVEMLDPKVKELSIRREYSTKVGAKVNKSKGKCSMTMKSMTKIKKETRVIMVNNKMTDKNMMRIRIPHPSLAQIINHLLHTYLLKRAKDRECSIT